MQWNILQVSDNYLYLYVAFTLKIITFLTIISYE